MDSYDPVLDQPSTSEPVTKRRLWYLLYGFGLTGGRAAHYHTPDDTLDKIDPAQMRQNVAAWTTVLAVLSGGIEPEPKRGKRR